MMFEGTRRRKTAAAVLATVALLGLAACGSDDDDQASSPGESATTAPGVATTAAAAATTTPAAPVLQTSNKDPFGTFLTDSAGKTLYVFDRDTTPNSSCTGRCATTWPALLVPDATSTPAAPAGATGELTVAPRQDRAGNQVVWNGKPLYRYSGDASPGDTTGDGIGGTWHVAKLS